LSPSQRRATVEAVEHTEEPAIVQDVEQAEDFAHPAAYDRQRWARGVGLTCAFDL
jgi:hypothetical protein